MTPKEETLNKLRNYHTHIRGAKKLNNYEYPQFRNALLKIPNQFHPLNLNYIKKIYNRAFLVLNE
jgi:hypothetical protein